MVAMTFEGPPTLEAFVANYFDTSDPHIIEEITKEWESERSFVEGLLEAYLYAPNEAEWDKIQLGIILAMDLHGYD